MGYPVATTTTKKDNMEKNWAILSEKKQNSEKHSLNEAGAIGKEPIFFLLKLCYHFFFCSMVVKILSLKLACTFQEFRSYENPF